MGVRRVWPERRAVYQSAAAAEGRALQDQRDREGRRLGAARAAVPKHGAAVNAGRQAAHLPAVPYATAGAGSGRATAGAAWRPAAAGQSNQQTPGRSHRRTAGAGTNGRGGATRMTTCDTCGAQYEIG